MQKMWDMDNLKGGCYFVRVFGVSVFAFLFLDGFE